MPGVTRTYVYRFTPPGDALTLATAITAAGQHVVKHNKHVQKVDTLADGEDMLMRVTVHGHDQWWIKKHIIYPVVGIFTKVGIKVKDVKLEEVQAPEHHNKTMEWKNDPDRMIEHDETVKPPRKARNDEAYHVAIDRARYLKARQQTQ